MTELPIALFLMARDRMVARVGKKDYLLKIGTPANPAPPLSIAVPGGYGLQVRTARQDGEVMVEASIDRLGPAVDFMLQIEPDRFIRRSSVTHRGKGMDVRLDLSDTGACGHIVRLMFRRFRDQDDVLVA